MNKVRHSQRTRRDADVEMAVRKMAGSGDIKRCRAQTAVDEGGRGAARAPPCGLGRVRVVYARLVTRTGRNLQYVENPLRFCFFPKGWALGLFQTYLLFFSTFPERNTNISILRKKKRTQLITSFKKWMIS